jgi:hypothetical protein
MFKNVLHFCSFKNDCLKIQTLGIPEPIDDKKKKMHFEWKESGRLSWRS